MLRVVMIDLGGTLEQNRVVLPFVSECLDVLRQFECADGSPVDYCLVSDYHLAVPFQPPKIEEIFRQYLQILASLHLQAHFAPPERRITLSTHVDLYKPRREVFEKALQRLGVDCPLQECMFVTENSEHIAAVNELGMDGLQFGSDGFSHWPEGLLRIAIRLTPESDHNLRLALPVFGQANDLEELQYVAREQNTVRASATEWMPIEDPTLESLSGINVPVPVQVLVNIPATGPVSMEVDRSAIEQHSDEMKAFVRSLHAHGQIDAENLASANNLSIRSATHFVETKADGRRLLKRRGFGK